MRLIRGFFRFWYDFLVGDDWKIAVAVSTTLVLAGIVLVTTGPTDVAFTVATGLALMVAFVIALRIDVRRH